MNDSESDLKLQSGFVLGSWTVLPNQNRLESEAGSEHLEPKVMGVLCALARSRGEVVSRDALIADVWEGRHVMDEVLSRAISVLRVCSSVSWRIVNLKFNDNLTARTLCLYPAV